MGRISKETLEKLWYLRREVDRLFDEYLGPVADPGDQGQQEVTVSADVVESSKDIVITVDLPGVKPEDVELFVQRDLIVLEGRKDRETDEALQQYHCLERSSGRFRRLIDFPHAADTQRIEAKLHQGVLTIRLPKVEERRGARRKVTLS